MSEGDERGNPLDCGSQPVACTAMNWKWIQLLVLALSGRACTSMAQPTNQTDLLREFRRRAANFNAVITVPQFETTTNAIRFDLKQTIAVGNAALDRIGALKPARGHFREHRPRPGRHRLSNQPHGRPLRADQGNQHQRRAARRRHRRPQAAGGMGGRH